MRHSWTFDPRDRVVTVTNQLSQTRYFRYDENGNRRFRVGRDSRVRTYVYNTVNLTTAERWYNNLSDAQSDSSRQNAITYTYDLVHRMTAATDSGSTFAYAYTLDMANRATSIVAGIAGLTPTVTFDQAFDDASRRAQLAAALDATNDFVNNYLYDAAGRMTRITQHGNGGNTVAPKRFDFAYDAVSRFDTITRYNNTAGTQTVAVSSYTFDNANRLTALTHDKGQTNFADYDWAYDDGGRITDQDFTSLVGTNGNADYTYDATNQLTASDYASDWQSDESYTYDENGNRTNGGYTVGANNRLTSDGTYYYTYDANGNRIARFIDVDTSGTLNANDTDITTYSWDHRNRLLTVATYATYGGSSTKVTTQVYDPANRWIKRTVDTDGTSGAGDILQRVFIYDGNQIVLQFDKTGTGSLVSADRSHRYVWGPNVDQILADGDLSGGMGAGSQSAMGSRKANARPSRPSGLGRRSAGARPRGGLGSKKASASPPVVRWPLCDHLNSVRDIANYNSGTDTTTVINHRVYDAFGKLTSETSPTIPHLFHYTGRALDTSTGQQYNTNRWYDPSVGRWDSEDPIGYEAEDMNLYRYVGNGPLTQTDPEGTDTYACNPNIGGRVNTPTVTAKCKKKNGKPPTWILDITWTKANIQFITKKFTVTITKPDGSQVMVTCDRTQADINDSTQHENKHITNCENKLQNLKKLHGKEYKSHDRCLLAKDHFSNDWGIWLRTEAIHGNTESPASTWSCEAEYKSSLAAGLCSKETPIKSKETPIKEESCV